ncbi:hypothetical protein HWV62_23621 [Athelia sp. TMB]|nr:hypothetical protein HWV62_23621 [Athelia sp. TMB]
MESFPPFVLDNNYGSNFQTEEYVESPIYEENGFLQSLDVYSFPSAGSSTTSLEEGLACFGSQPVQAPNTATNWGFDSKGFWQQQYLPPTSEDPYHSRLPLYAPVPRHMVETLPSPAEFHFPATQPQYATHPSHFPAAAVEAPISTSGPIRTNPRSRRVSRESGKPYPQQPSLLHSYDLGAGPQMTFQTPSELLQDLSRQDADPAPQSKSQSQSQPGQEAETRHASQRKARLNALADSIGFIPTDPDTISSHEKKRHYLECLEHYIVYIHDQLRLVGHTPVTLERVSTYRGLSSRSIRTLLVHMENNVRKLHQQTLSEEQVWKNLRHQVVSAQEAHDAAALEYRRHSIAACSATEMGSGGIETIADATALYLQ